MRALAADPEVPVGEDEITALLTFPLDLAGSARRQVRDVAEQAAARVAAHPSAAIYRPGAIL